MVNKKPTNPEEVVIPTPSPEIIDTPSEEEHNNTMAHSHLRRRNIRQTKKIIVLTSLGLIGIFALLILFGPTLLINLSLVLSKDDKGQDVIVKQDTLYIAPPALDSQPTATNSASIRITGESSIGIKGQIKLYVNGELQDVSRPGENNKFSFDNVKLKEGENTLKAIATQNEQKSNDSNIVTITFIKVAPDVSVESPQDGQTFSGENKTATVKGKTDPNAHVAINDFIPIMKADGTFSYVLPLQNGENNIKIVVTDDAGNSTQKDIKVTYSP